MKTIKELLCMTQRQVYNEVLEQIKGFDVKYIKEGSYIVVGQEENKRKPMLCVHLDTINTHRLGSDVPLNGNWFGYDRKVGKIYCKDTKNLTCLGADDRAGVWIALRLLANEQLRDKFVFGFFYDEEIGGKGSSEYAKDVLDYEDYVSCFIGLDRRGVDEVALYDKDNTDLTKICNNLGYKTAMGSFTDASNLSRNVACVNLSVGYDHEHTTAEVLYTAGMVGTLNILENNWQHFSDTLFEVEEDDYSYYRGEYGRYQDNFFDDPVLCDCCGQHLPLYAEGNYFVCSECIGVYTWEENL